jgi:hypothetical protein
MKHTHTTLPWATDFWRCHAKKCINIGQPQLFGGSPIIQVIATVPVASDEYSDEEAANAAFIVRACNSHYEMLSALENAANVLAGLAVGHLDSIKSNSPALLKIRAAISKAKE